MMSWVLLAAAIVFNVIGNLMMKKFALDEPVNNIYSYANPIFIVGASLFGVNLLFYAKAVQTIPIVVAYPVLVGSSIILITFAAVSIYAEKVSGTMLFGMALIVLGISLVTRGAS